MTVPRDADSLKYLPETAEQWTELLSGTGLSNPANLYLFQEASGNILDKIGSKDLSASGTLAYQQNVPDWTRNAVATTVNVAGQMKNTTFANVNAQAYTVFLIVRPTVVGGQPATVVRIGDLFDDDVTAEMLNTPVYRLGHGTTARTNGGLISLSNVDFITLRSSPGVAVKLSRRGDADLVGGTLDANGTELCFGGDFINTWNPPTAQYMYAAVWTSMLSDADITTLYSRIDNGPPAVASEPASLGGIMTIALLAQQGARRDRQIVYGPKWPMLRKRK